MQGLLVVWSFEHSYKVSQSLVHTIKSRRSRTKCRWVDRAPWQELEGAGDFPLFVYGAPNYSEHSDAKGVNRVT